MESILKKINGLANTRIIRVIFINVIIFIIANIVFSIKYEEVDDFIIYNLYSGLDGTYTIYGIYIYPLICFVIGGFFKILPMINWHTIFLLSMQFICFTIIGNILLKKDENKFSYILYILFASVFYATLLQLIQYTSVAALLIATSFFMIMNGIEQEEKSKKYKILYFVLFTIGIMIRMQSLLIVVPFFAIYLGYQCILKIKNAISKEKLRNILKQYLILVGITILVYGSNYLVYHTNDVYKEYMEYNDVRVILQDLSFTDYESNKEIFDQIGWSKNDYYLFYTYNFGDENIYSKENLQKILDYKESKNKYYRLNTDVENILECLKKQMIEENLCITILFLVVTVTAIITNRNQRGYIIALFLVTICVNVIFIILNRNILRVVIPEYILGSAMMLYLIIYSKKKTTKRYIFLKIICVLLLVGSSIFSGSFYHKGYDRNNYKNYRNLIQYTNSHKENVYLYTSPSMQCRYLVYSVYEMPPQAAFSNLRVMGGWDIFSKNYYDFKERYHLEGTFLDLLKNNVYLIDRNMKWMDMYYRDYIIQSIKEHYHKEVTCEKIEEFDDVYIYKLKEK